MVEYRESRSDIFPLVVDSLTCYRISREAPNDIQDEADTVISLLSRKHHARRDESCLVVGLFKPPQPVRQSKSSKPSTYAREGQTRGLGKSLWV